MSYDVSKLLVLVKLKLSGFGLTHSRPMYSNRNHVHASAYIENDVSFQRCPSVILVLGLPCAACQIPTTQNVLFIIYIINNSRRFA